MNFDPIEITINAALTSSTGIPLPAGVVVKGKPEDQLINHNNTLYRSVIQFWFNQECYDGGKAPITIEGIHPVFDTGTDGDPLYVTGALELQSELAITDPADIDTAQKCKDLIIAELATLLSLTAEDFS
jgi:hypothetical protein